MYAGDLGSDRWKLYDEATGALLGEASADKLHGWRDDEGHVNWWDWSQGKRGTGGRFGHEYYSQSQVGAYSTSVKSSVRVRERRPQAPNDTRDRNRWRRAARKEEHVENPRGANLGKGYQQLDRATTVRLQTQIEAAAKRSGIDLDALWEQCISLEYRSDARWRLSS